MEKAPGIPEKNSIFRVILPDKKMPDMKIYAAVISCIGIR